MKVIGNPIRDMEQVDNQPMTPIDLECQIDQGNLSLVRIYLQLYSDRYRANPEAGNIPSEYNQEEIDLLWKELKSEENKIKIEAGEYDTHIRKFKRALKKVSDRLEEKVNSGEYTCFEDGKKDLEEFRNVITKDLKMYSPRQIWEPYNQLKEEFASHFKRKVVGL